MFDLTKYIERSSIVPYEHQKLGITKLVESPYFFIADEMGAGKTLQVIIAAMILFELDLIDRVIVVAPVPVRSVWFDQELGELKKHLWPDLPVWVTEYHARRRRWEQGQPRPDKRILRWVITNYDFIRSEERRSVLKGLCSKRTLLVLDESSAIKNASAKQTKACIELRRLCGRVILLNGTPIANNPGDLFSQAFIMDPGILGCKSYFHFRSRYAQMGGWQGRVIIGWHDVDDIQRRLAPYILRRLKTQCLDLPAKLPSVPLTATLTPATWNVYKQMRDDMVAWLSEDTLATAQQSIVRVLRLAQITSGFIGGVQQGDVDYCETTEESETPAVSLETNLTQSLGTEKEDLFIYFLDELLQEDPNIKVLVWCRFRAQLKRLYDRLASLPMPKGTILSLGAIWGGQKKPERDLALRLLDPRTAPKGPVVVVGTPATGSMGLNLTAAHTVVYLSNDYNLKTRLQSEDRVHRPGQISPVSYFDVIAEGPQGQKTIDHATAKALQEKDNMATWTTSAWISALTE